MAFPHIHSTMLSKLETLEVDLTSLLHTSSKPLEVIADMTASFLLIAPDDTSYAPEDWELLACSRVLCLFRWAWSSGARLGGCPWTTTWRGQHHTALSTILPLPLCSPQSPLLLNNLSLQEGTALPLALLLPELEQIPEFSWTMQVIGYTLSLPMFACLLLFSLLLLAAFNFGKPVLKRTVTKQKQESGSSRWLSWLRLLLQA